MHHSVITEMQNHNADTRRRLVLYCLKDALLPILMMQKLSVVLNQIEFARVTGIPVAYVQNRGQQVRCQSMISRKAAEKNLVCPFLPRTPNDGYEGATVIEPQKGFYEQPVGVLDFASLYPSIMIANNLCYTTLVVDANYTGEKIAMPVHDKDGHRDYFVPASTQRGLIPEILIDLLDARKRIRAEAKEEKDPFVKALLNKRQLAMKVSANSVYGFCGTRRERDGVV